MMWINIAAILFLILLTLITFNVISIKVRRMSKLEMSRRKGWKKLIDIVITIDD